ncbi:MAG TPA: hypothetical protein VM221_09910 [Armatimonadota bacterium]|nr:hypothetical protein [Armatimonadota bacterium]
MTRPRKRPVPDGTGTLVFGIIFTILGAGLLIQRITGLDVWDYLWQLWPLLLIVMGVKVLIDHYTARPSPPLDPARGAPQPVAKTPGRQP